MPEICENVPLCGYFNVLKVKLRNFRIFNQEAKNYPPYPLIELKYRDIREYRTED